MTSTSPTIIRSEYVEILSVAARGGWRNVVRVAVGLGLTADEVMAAGDDAWDDGDMDTAGACSNAAAWWSMTPSQKRTARVFPAPESVGTDPIGSPSQAGLPTAGSRRTHDRRPGAFCVCDACAYTGSARGAW